MVTESRETYLPFDHSWLDSRALQNKARVVVTLVPRTALGTHQYDVSSVSASHGTTDADMNEDTEIFHVVMSLPLTPSTDHNQRHYASSADIQPVDEFLRRNPCFMPLHDPPVNISTPGNNGARDHQDFGGPWYRHSAIFIRLPAKHFHPTCRLYTFITERQHPAECPTLAQKDKYLPAAVGMIGWTNTLDFFVMILRHAMYTNRLFISARSSGTINLQNPNAFHINVDGVSKRIEQTWDSWADPAYCAAEDFAWNPWACNFISLSKCNTYAMINHDYNEGDRQMEKAPHPPTPYMSFLDKEFFPNMTRFMDGAHDGSGYQGDFEYRRLVAFVQRANIYLRSRIRASLLDLVQSRPPGRGRGGHNKGDLDRTEGAGAGAGAGAGVGGGGGGGAGTSRSVAAAGIGGNAPLLGACVALHVRNGDGLLDMRNNAGHNLSFAAHMKCLESIALGAGTFNIYLATDNATLFDDGVRLYPQYKWYYQKRPLLLFDGTNPAGTRKNAKSPQEDLADLLADCILISRCTSIMRSYSALSDLFFTFMCNRNVYGLCPPERAAHGNDCQAELGTVYKKQTDK